MNQFLLVRGRSHELLQFPHIVEIGLKKNASIQFGSLPVSVSQCIRLYFIIDGRFEWEVAGRPCTAYPSDLLYVLPGQTFGGANGYLDIGSLAWIFIEDANGDARRWKPGNWSSLSEIEKQTIGNILMMNPFGHLCRVADTGRIFTQLHTELVTQEIGYRARVNQLTDELLITATRQVTRQNVAGRDFPKIFLQLEQKLRQNLSHQWTVEEMAASVGMGTTLFNERVKNFSGFSPLNYLINIRITEAIRLLKKPGINVTDIALDTGFYSSQHFSTTFKKLTGYTPSQFRKKNSEDI
ncbi:helix-turn-helix transcriptional regulator [Foetidibacter luteolus]|uniref:helix-turn-helix transcriptional regulator n=1 Tax=Foetidibacter luteolus TaxID=2608880 RepID=UPI00129B0C2C|nr:AraC family transcriptional regulator [Foetidibacter luteolus]